MRLNRVNAYLSQAKRLPSCPRVARRLATLQACCVADRRDVHVSEKVAGRSARSMHGTPPLSSAADRVLVVLRVAVAEHSPRVCRATASRHQRYCYWITQENVRRRTFGRTSCAADPTRVVPLQMSPRGIRRQLSRCLSAILKLSRVVGERTSAVAAPGLVGVHESRQNGYGDISPIHNSLKGAVRLS